MLVSIVTPEREAWRGEADLVIARSTEGEFGVMQDHIPLLAALVPGTVTVTGTEGRDVFFVSGGFLESSGHGEEFHVIVLADDAEPTGELEAAELQRRVEEARSHREDERRGDVATAGVEAAAARVDLS